MNKYVACETMFLWVDFLLINGGCNGHSTWEEFEIISFEVTINIIRLMHELVL
jgi:hypothetical protein